MRSSSLIIVIGIIFIILTDTILWYQLKQYLRKKWQILLYILHNLIFVVSLILYQVYIPHLKGPESYFWIEIFVGILFLFYTPKLIFIILNGIGKIFKRLLPAFSRFMTILAGSIAGLLFIILLYSITYGRYNYKTEIVEVPMEGLPAAFNGFKIVQLSDLHLGSYGEGYRGNSPTRKRSK